MQFSWIAVLISVAVASIGGWAAWGEGNFLPNDRIKLPFSLHGGIWGDLFILPLAFGLWVPYFKVPWWGWLFILLPAAFGITWFCHRGWWAISGSQPDYMFPDRYTSRDDIELWYRDLPLSAWIHFVYMIGALMMIGGYLYTSMPAEVVWKTCWLMVIFVPVAVIEPGIIKGWPLTTKDIVLTAGSAIALWSLVGLVTLAKLNHWLGR